MIAKLGAERAADLLEATPPDDAADILGELPEQQAELLLAGMDPAEAADGGNRLRHDDESDGGIITPEVTALRQDLTVEDASATPRGLANSADVEGVSGVAAAAVGRLRWLAVTFAGGLLAVAVLRAFTGPNDVPTAIVAFAPLLVLLAGELVAQTTAVMSRGIGLGAGAGVGAGGLTGEGRFGLVVGLATAINTVIAVAIGTRLPLTRDRLDPLVYHGLAFAVAR